MKVSPERKAANVTEFDPHPPFQDYAHPGRLVSAPWLSARLGIKAATSAAAITAGRESPGVCSYLLAKNNRNYFRQARLAGNGYVKQPRRKPPSGQSRGQKLVTSAPAEGR